MSWLTRLESLALVVAFAVAAVAVAVAAVAVAVAVAVAAVDTVAVGSNLEVAAYHESTSFGTSWVTLTMTTSAVLLIWYTLKNA